MAALVQLTEVGSATEVSGRSIPEAVDFAVILSKGFLYGSQVVSDVSIVTEAIRDPPKKVSTRDQHLRNSYAQLNR